MKFPITHPGRMDVRRSEGEGLRLRGQQAGGHAR